MGLRGSDGKMMTLRFTPTKTLTLLYLYLLSRLDQYFSRLKVRYSILFNSTILSILSRLESMVLYILFIPHPRPSNLFHFHSVLFMSIYFRLSTLP